jgi:hypothetical protein
MSITLQAPMHYQLGDHSAIQFTPRIIVADPLNGLNPNNWIRAREDIHFFGLLGYVYNW